jgi:hypothetical protein
LIAAMSASASFVHALAESGRVRVPIGPAAAFVADEAAEEALRTLDASLRLDAPAVAPTFDLAAAVAGARLVFDACRFLVDRTLGADVVKSVLVVDRAVVPTPSSIWSIDLCLRCLPDLFVQARARSADDPLVSGLVAAARDWPLSGVGLAVPGERVLPEALQANECLRRMLVDRVIERGDAELARIPWIAASIAAVRGAYPGLVPPRT